MNDAVLNYLGMYFFCNIDYFSRNDNMEIPVVVSKSVRNFLSFVIEFWIHNFFTQLFMFLDIFWYFPLLSKQNFVFLVACEWHGAKKALIIFISSWTMRFRFGFELFLFIFMFIVKNINSVKKKVVVMVSDWWKCNAVFEYFIFSFGI